MNDTRKIFVVQFPIFKMEFLAYNRFDAAILGYAFANKNGYDATIHSITCPDGTVYTNVSINVFMKEAEL